MYIVQKSWHLVKSVVVSAVAGTECRFESWCCRLVNTQEHMAAAHLQVAHCASAGDVKAQSKHMQQHNTLGWCGRLQNS
jgi:hypothetical protein